MCAEPGQTDDTSVYNKHHDRIVKCQDALRLYEHLIQVLRRFRELLILIFLSYIRLHNTDRGYILLNTGIQLIVAGKRRVEQLHGLAHDQCQHAAKNQNCRNEDQT